MESPERFVFHHPLRNRYRFTDSLAADFAIPFTADLGKGQTAVKLIQDNPYHDARALECGLPTADSGIGHNVPSQFDSPTLCICLRLHAAAPNYAPGTPPLQASEVSLSPMRDRETPFHNASHLVGGLQSRTL